MLNQPGSKKAVLFIQDVNRLPMDHAIIAAKMKIAASSFGKYYNGIVAIPDLIIERFYKSFEEELKILKKMSKSGIGNKANMSWNERFRQLEVRVDTLVQYNGTLLREVDNLRKSSIRVEEKISRSTVKPNSRARAKQS